jgi:ferredoxin, 2Fe-2S
VDKTDTMTLIGAANTKSQTKTDGRMGMPKVRFLPVDVEVEVPEGTILLDAALNNNIKINHNCGGNCACSTCHVHIEQGYDSLNQMSEDEQDMLDEAEDVSEVSRLACQCKVTSDLVVRIPESDIEDLDLDDDL